MKIFSFCIRGIRDSINFVVRRIVFFAVNAIAVHPSFRPIQEIRCLLLRLLHYKIGQNVNFSESLYILNQGLLEIDNNCCFGSFCKIYNFNKITIGRGLLASHGISLISGTHDPISLEEKSGVILIGENVWIGINVTIVGPVSIGNNVTIGASSLVIKDVPDNAIVAGVPAKIIRMKPPQKL